MRCLGLDLGTKTLGIAISDRTNVIANPYKTIKFNDTSELIEPLKDIIMQESIGEIALGLPKNMDGTMGFASDRSLNFKKLLENFESLVAWLACNHSESTLSASLKFPCVNGR